MKNFAKDFLIGEFGRGFVYCSFFQILQYNSIFWYSLFELVCSLNVLVRRYTTIIITYQRTMEACSGSKNLAPLLDSLSSISLPLSSSISFFNCQISSTSSTLSRSCIHIHFPSFEKEKEQEIQTEPDEEFTESEGRKTFNLGIGDNLRKEEDLKKKKKQRKNSCRLDFKKGKKVAD